jgi:hypothetical protein
MDADKPNIHVSSGPAPSLKLEEDSIPLKILIRSTTPRYSTELLIQLESIYSHRPMAVKALLDSGATGLFIDADFVKAKGLSTTKLTRAIPVYNIDGTLNQLGSVKETVDLIIRYKDHTERQLLYVTALGSVPLILGYPWLCQHNPEIDWATGEVHMTRCPSECRVHHIQAQRKRREKIKSLKEQTQSSDPVMEFQVPVPKATISPIHIKASSTVSQRLAEAAAVNQRKRTFEETVPKEYHAFRKVFEKDSFDELPQHRKWDHAIDLIPGSESFSSKLYPISPNEQGELNKFLDENLATGRIIPSKSSMASPVFFVKKKDGSLRFVQDYRKLNAITVRNRYPLPLIPDMMTRMAGARYFTKLDVRWGYNNIRIREGDEWKAAFRTNRGLYEPRVMFFGLCNSPATFQTMMNDIFRQEIDQGVVVVYMDDILIFTDTLEEHRLVVKRVLQILQDNNLYLKPDKCVFETEKVEFLGLILSKDKVEMDPVKIEGVSQWPAPRSVKELQSFLGFINFYRRFIEDFSKIAKPLHNLTKKDVKFIWTTEHQEAFDSLKTRVTSAPILVQPDARRPFKLETDASDYATGAILSQLCEDDKWRPVGFLSKSLKPEERNYPVHDKELLSVMRALREWRYLLEGASHQIIIYNDHRNLTYFMKAQNLNRRQARWSLELASFDFVMHHRPGKSSGKPDALSRRDDHDHGDDDNLGQTLLPSLLVRSGGGIMLNGVDEDFMGRIQGCGKRESAVLKGLTESKSSIGQNRSETWMESEGIVTYNGRIYVPPDPELRYDIVKAHHDSPVVGHPGRWKTEELVARNYWWPGMRRYIASYVRGCDACQRTKTYPAAPAGRLRPNAIPDRRWQIITTDLITGLPNSHGFDSIWVTVDRLSKRIHIAPTTAEVDSVGIARLFRDNVWKHHGLPEQIISDRGPQFVSAFTRELNRLLGIQTTPSTAFHPQTDGQTERVNQEIEQYLRVFVNRQQNDWSEWLPLAEFAYNNRIHSSTRMTPFELDNGQHPRLGVEPRRETKVEAVREHIDQIKEMIVEAQSALKRAAEDMARFHDAKRGKPTTFKVGDMVWLDSSNIKTTRQTKKLDDKWFGPFPVVKVLSESVYELKLTEAFDKVNPRFNVIKLRRFEPDQIAERPKPLRPEPEIDEAGEKVYEVEMLLDSRIHRRQFQYLVKWKGYGPEYNTWEPAKNLGNAKRRVKEFHDRNPEALKPTSSAQR